MIKKHRPKRLLFLCHWVLYYCRNFWGTPKCDINKLEKDLVYLVQKIQEIQGFGV